jgi:hypothetical protein
MMPAQKGTASARATKATDSISKGADLTREAIEAQARLGGEFADAVGNAMKDSGNAFEASRAYADAVWREAGNYWQAVNELNVRYASELLKIGASTGDQVLAAVDTALKSGRSANGAASSGNAAN